MSKDFIVTYTGIKFYITNPKPEDINPVDIAHSLSLMCRGNGHLGHFYSVAQHCINCYNEAKARGYSKKVQLALLLHDASEGYISDITRPVKQFLPEYFKLEKAIQDCIYKRFGIDSLTDEERSLIGEIDDNFLCVEFEDNHVYKGAFKLTSPIISKPILEFKDMGIIEKMYLELLRATETIRTTP
ncbi:MAG: HD domain-containing protein [Clostridia bacterium]|nr:HD domain-containing protein [Clostridia bacterium]